MLTTIWTLQIWQQIWSQSAMKLAEEEDLWIGDSGLSIHMMGSEEHVFNKK